MGRLFFGLVIGEERTLSERFLMGEGNFSIDLVELFAYSVYSDFSKGFTIFPHSTEGRLSCCPDYPFSFSLKSFLSGYRQTSANIPMEQVTICFFLEAPLVCPTQIQFADL